MTQASFDAPKKQAPPATASQIAEWHEHYCLRLRRFAANCGSGVIVTPPTFEIQAGRGRKAGVYYPETNKCVYFAAYFGQPGLDYEKTVAHEVCHSFAKQLMPESAWHGEFFLFLLRVVCGFRSASIRHNYDVASAKRLEEALKLAKRIGRLTS